MTKERVRLSLTARLSGAEPRQECCACAAPATHFVILEGESGRKVRLVACARHESIAVKGAQGLVRFLHHRSTKEDFLADPDAMKEDARQRRAKDR